MIKSLYKLLVPERHRNNIRRFWKRLAIYRLKGNDFCCNCCGIQLSAFLPKGNGIQERENAECPNCGSLERTRVLFFYLEQQTRIFKAQPKILHVSPEPILKKKFKGNPNYVDVDINPQLASVTMDITAIRLPDQSIDYVICSHVLGHVRDEQKAIDELYRILKPGGEAYIMTLQNPVMESTLEIFDKLSPEQRLKHYGEADLERLHGRDFMERLKRSHVKIERVDYRLTFSDEDQQKYCLGDGEREVIFVCRRK